MRDMSLLIIPIWLITQKLSSINLLVLNQMAALLESLGIHCTVTSVTRSRVINGATTDISEARLKVEGIINVLTNLLPQLLTLSQFFFWKSRQLTVLIEVARYVNISAHLLLPGLELLVRYLFSVQFVPSDDPDRQMTLSNLLAFIATMIATANARSLTGQMMITLEVTKHNATVYRVRLPAFMMVSPKSKMFNANAYGSPEQALNAAVAYRDTTISNWLSDNNIKSH
jgi:hypothetical protein